MNEYIKKEDVLTLIDTGCLISNSNYNKEIKLINELPSADVEPVKHGHWKVVSDEYGGKAYICECSECEDTVWVYKDANRKWNYCPNCGTKMDEEEQENE